MMKANKANAQVLFPFLIPDDFLGAVDKLECRYVIDFQPRDLLKAKAFKQPFEHLEQTVLPARKE
ncbi:hypothetical protein, partial [Vibrio parahaemolyticus]|uniref:hypothetical protein n=1 Tax=Vibrio parahaemolyticus TaxID=670 RepID=UPI001A8D0AF1